MRDVEMKCCSGKFPTFPVVLLAIGVIWLLNDLGVFTVKIPWMAVAIIVLSLGWIMNWYSKN